MMRTTDGGKKESRGVYNLFVSVFYFLLVSINYIGTNYSFSHYLGILGVSLKKHQKTKNSAKHKIEKFTSKVIVSIYT